MTVQAARCSTGQSDAKFLKDLLTLNGQVGRDDVAFVQNLIAPKRDNLQVRIEGCWKYKKNMYGQEHEMDEGAKTVDY